MCDHVIGIYNGEEYTNATVFTVSSWPEYKKYYLPNSYMHRECDWYSYCPYCGEDLSQVKLLLGVGA